MPILDWLNRDKDVRTADTVPYRLLEDIPELSFGDTHSPNMLIQGDNLEALKSLLPYYAGQVKCIYADPPFNTKQAFAGRRGAMFNRCIDHPPIPGKLVQCPRSAGRFIDSVLLLAVS